jgi:hypothetical protein
LWRYGGDKMAGTLDGLSTSEQDKELFSGAPNLGAAFKASAGQDYTTTQKELTVQTRLLNSYTSTREDIKQEYEGMTYDKRLELVTQEIDQQAKEPGFQYDNVSGIESAIESKKQQVGLFSDLNMPNEKAAELKEAYEFVRYQRLPVQSYDEVKAVEDSSVVYSKEFIDKIKDGYDQGAHSLVSGDIKYDLNVVDEKGENIGLINENSLKGQFTTQFENLEDPNFVYTRQGTYGMEYAQTVEMTEERQDFGLTSVSMKAGEERVSENGSIRYEQNEAFEQEAHRVSRNANGTPLVESVSTVSAADVSMPDAELPSAELPVAPPGMNGP